MKMKIVVEKELDIGFLYDNIRYDFTSYDACEEANITDSDLTDDVMIQIFIKLADVVRARRDAPWNE